MNQVTSLNQTLAIPFIVTGLILFLFISVKLLIFPRPSHQSDQAASNQDVKVLMSGAMGSGKTRLWSRLVYGTGHIETVTSMMENKITFNLKKPIHSDEKQLQGTNDLLVRLIDTPGHPRLSYRSLARNLPHSKGVIFVIDSQSGLSGKGLRDTCRSLESVISLLQLLHSQDPSSPLPKLLIHLANISQSASLSKSAMIEKSQASLMRELIRSRNNRNGTSNQKSNSRLESMDEIPSSDLNSLYDTIIHFFKLFQPSNGMGIDQSSAVQLPEEETEIIKLLDLEEENLSADDKLLDPLARWEKVSGHSIQWTASQTDNEEGINLIQKWLIEM